MRVLVFSEKYWPEGSGGILASHLIARILRDARLRLTVVHGTREPVKLNGVRYVYSSLLSVRDKHRLWLNCSILARKHWLRELISSSDVVYIPRYCYPLIPAVKGLGKKVVVHLHDYQPISYNSIVFSEQTRSGVDAVSFEILEHGSVARALFAGFTSSMNRLCRVWLRDADVIICVSRRQAEIISRLAPELTERLKVVYNPLPNIALVEKNLGYPTFLYLGGDSYVKGFHLLLRTSQRILTKGRKVRFLLAGNFKERGRSLIKVLNKGFGGAYRLLGHLQHEGVLKLHSVSHALLLPSICEEPLPYTVMESMVAGTIPIASRVGGVPEIVRNTFAEKMLFRPGDAEELVDKMEMLLNMSREQLVDISAELREKALEKFDNERVKQQLLEVFAA